MKVVKIGFIGGGNMATALLKGLLYQGTPAHHIGVFDIVDAVCQRWKSEGVCIAQSGDELVAQHDVLIAAIKPQQAADIFDKLISLEGKLLISVMAGITVQRLQQMSGTQMVVRVMPNTPALIGEGASGVYFSEAINPDQKVLTLQLLQGLGAQAEVVNEERLIDVITALSGSGPAYFFAFMEALVAAAKQQGLSEEQALNLTLQTAKGAAMMGLNSPNLAQLREAVTSPGGTTAAALEVLKPQLADLVQATVDAAYLRSQELST